MKILIVAQGYYPENFKSNDLSFELSRRGHDVTVLTGLPNYPEGEIYPGYGFFKNLNQEINGVRVIRSWLLPRGKGGGFRLFLNYYSFAFFASIRAFFLGTRERFDAVIVHAPSPIMQFYPAWVLKWLHKTPVYFWIMDLWPESLEVAGGIKNKWVLGYYENLATKFYKNSEKILITSRGFERSIRAKGDFSDKIEYFPNWAEDSIAGGTADYPIPDLPEGFRIMFAGNVGEAQDLDAVMRAALELRNERHIKWIIVGDGRKMPFVKEFIEQHGLHETVRAVGRFPVEAMATFFNAADVMLVSLKDNPLFTLTVPARIQAYMSAGKPIVVMLNGEGADIINEAGNGISVPAGDFHALAAAVQKLSKLAPDTLTQMGKNSRKYFEDHFTLSGCIDELEKILRT
ncbi:MAG: glycosyltransferase WbuB [Chryseobacterium sp.]|nr:MAG: glycosyltransferase WbuB [Chryseobacterium sp.]